MNMSNFLGRKNICGIYRYEITRYNTFANIEIECLNNLALRILLDNNTVHRGFEIDDDNNMLFCSQYNIHLPLVAKKPCLYEVYTQEEINSYIEAMEDIRRVLFNRGSYHAHNKDYEVIEKDAYNIQTLDDLEKMVCDLDKYYSTNQLYGRNVIFKYYLDHNTIKFEMTKSIKYILKVVYSKIPTLWNFIKNSNETKFEFTSNNVNELVDLIKDMNYVNDELAGKKLFYQDIQIHSVSYLSLINQDYTDDNPENVYLNKDLFPSFRSALIYANNQLK